MDERVKQYLIEKYGQDFQPKMETDYQDRANRLNTANAFANLGDVFGGGKVGSLNPYFEGQRGLAEAQTLGKLEKDQALAQREMQAKDLLDLKKAQMARDAELAKENRDYRNQMLGLKRQEIGMKADKAEKPSLTEGQKALDKDYAKDFNEWTSSGQSALQKNLDRLQNAKRLIEQSKDDWTGPSGRFVGRLPNIVKPESNLKIKQDVQAAAQGALKATLGAQFTEKEGERIMNQAYDETLSPEENIRKIDMAIKELQNNATVNNMKAQHFMQTGSLQGFKAPLVNEDQMNTSNANDVNDEEVRSLQRQKRIQELRSKIGGK